MIQIAADLSTSLNSLTSQHRGDKRPHLLTIVSTMFGFELRRVLAAKNTSATLWWRIISRIMVQAQKVPLRPPPFLHEKKEINHETRKNHGERQTHKKRGTRGEHEWPDEELVEQLRQPLRGRAAEWNVTVWLSTDQARCQEKGQATVTMDIWAKLSLKYGSGDLISHEMSNTQCDLQRSEGPDMELGDKSQAL